MSNSFPISATLLATIGIICQATPTAAVSHDIVLTSVLVAGTVPITSRRGSLSHTGYSAVGHKNRFVVGVSCAPIESSDLLSSSWCEVDFYGRFISNVDGCGQPRYIHTGYSGSDHLYTYNNLWRVGLSSSPDTIFAVEDHTDPDPFVVGCVIGEKYSRGQGDWLETMPVDLCRIELRRDLGSLVNLTCSSQSTIASEFHSGDNTWSGLELSVRTF